MIVSLGQMERCRRSAHHWTGLPRVAVSCTQVATVANLSLEQVLADKSMLERRGSMALQGTEWGVTDALMFNEDEPGSLER